MWLYFGAEVMICAAIFRHIVPVKYIIKKSIDYGGTTFLTFRGPEGKKGEFWKKLQVFRKTGEPCPHCKSPIKRIIVGQRGTHYCKNKQKL